VEIERHYNLQRRILKVRAQRLRGRILNVKEYMLELNSQVHSQPKISRILQISPDTANRVSRLIKR
jgi:hypothetical protein